MTGRKHERLALSREHVKALIAAGRNRNQVGRALRMPPGPAFMVASGTAADGGGSPELQHSARPRPQVPVSPRGRNPLRNEATERWVRERAQRGFGGVHGEDSQKRDK